MCVASSEREHTNTSTQSHTIRPRQITLETTHKYCYNPQLDVNQGDVRKHHPPHTMGLSINCWKYLLLTYHVLFAMSAVVLFGASGFFLYRLFAYRHFVGVRVEYPVILLLLVAIVTVAVARFGWKSAITLHHVHIVISSVLISAVVAVELAVFVWSLVVWDVVELDLRATISSYFSETAVLNQPNSVHALRWDRLHVQMECCGVSGPTDFSAAGHVPFSCCGQGPLDSLHKPYTADCSTLYQRGCGKPLYHYVRDQLMFVAMTALTAAVLQSVGIFVSWALSRSVSRSRSVLGPTSPRDPNTALLTPPTAPQHTLQKY